MTKFSVVFIHKLLYNAGKNSVKLKEKNRLETKEKWAKLNDKIQKAFVVVFAVYEFDLMTWKNLKKVARKHKKT